MSRKATGFSVTAADWLETLQAIGLADAEVATVETGAGAALLMTAQLSSQRISVKGSGTAVLVGEDETGGSETMSAFATLLASSGLHVSLVLDSELGPSHLTETPALIVVFSQDLDTHVAPAKRLLEPLPAPQAPRRLHRPARDDAVGCDIGRDHLARQG